MRKALALILFLTAASSLFAVQAGLMRASAPGQPATGSAKTEKFALAYLDAEIRAGRFVLSGAQTDSLSFVEHRRYQQLAAGLPVWGGEVIVHLRNGKAESCDGQYFLAPASLETTPALTRAQALQAFEGGIKATGLVLDAERTALVVYPVSETEFRLAYKLWARDPGKPMFNESALVDAADGTVYLHFSNIQTDLLIGVGLGQRGDTLKFPTYRYNNAYYLWDQAAVRPFTQRTFDGKHQYGADISISNSANNSWPSDNIVNIHTYVGYTYDFYFLNFGLKGPNNANLPLTSFAHIYSVSQGLYDNAFWLSDNALYGQGMYFLDPYNGNKDYGAAFDIVAHELSHAVTTYHANLTYFGEPGALNESFSDVMGTAAEWHFQPAGTGYNLADWANGEDASPPAFTYDKCRRQDNPNLNSQLKNAGYSSAYWYPDPAHIAQKVPTLYSGTTAIDNDNVHVNCTIFPHVFYLLAHGGANPYSNRTVAAIGFEAAKRIFYDAFVNRMTSSTNFLGASNALLASALSLYGASSNEYAQTKEAIRAIGYTVS
jgi:bacillolysin